ncbi:MAG: HEAT repeat domain-containing protein [Planctomycetaceae bacterium]|nr:HEAT repeat domain-containing protein [Planctomycetales bacterium]MCB9925864.1 HEAT repeat domain-containing protein [Planctomycetaceae bacterium]
MPSAPDSIPSNPTSKRWLRSGGLVLALLLGGGVFADWWTCLPDDEPNAYVGGQACIQCHQQESRLWEGSHHDLAMDLATPATVIGNFDDAELEHYGITTRMFRRDGKYMVNTEGPDGEMTDFEVKYVFGVDPLQQYMVEFDRPAEMPQDEIARLQVLRVSWDTEKKEWFYLRPPDVDEKLAPDDDLHWTGIAQRWNNMCADCHSTNLRKSYNDKTKTYHTTFSEIDVSCEACHGPGGVHVKLAESKSLFWDRKYGYGLAKLKGNDTKKQLDTCFQCHSRRRIVKPGYRPGEDFYDYFSNELLLAHTYYPDGQILDEVYVHGSFIQSKMYHKGIRCTDCHDPHTARLKHQGNQVCTSCHQHSAGKYDAPSHHRHNVGSTGASCVECHMPETTYMAVDARRDHSLRIPRPDLSVAIGTPNACTRCHLDRAKLPDEKRSKLTQYADWLIAARDDEEIRSAVAEVDQWSAKYYREWYGEKKDLTKQFANTLVAARKGEAEAAPDLAAIARDKRLPGIVRATSLYELGQYAPSNVLETAEQLLSDDDPQVRITAVADLQLLDDDTQLMRLLLPSLEDPVRAVRTEAARVLARVPRQLMNGGQRRMLQAALDEFKEGVLVNNDRAAAHLTLGVVYESMNDLQSAEAAYLAAIRVEPQVTGPRTNLAALLERQADEAENNARRIAQQNREAAIEGIVKSQQLRERVAELRKAEMPLLGRDAKLAPDNAAIQYRYGLSLYLHGQVDEALESLITAVRLEPNTPDFVLALALLYRHRGDLENAIKQIERLLELRPNDPSYQQLYREVRQQAVQPTGPTVDRE